MIFVSFFRWVHAKAKNFYLPLRWDRRMERLTRKFSGTSHFRSAKPAEPEILMVSFTNCWPLSTVSTLVSVESRNWKSFSMTLDATECEDSPSSTRCCSHFVTVVNSYLRRALDGSYRHLMLCYGYVTRLGTYGTTWQCRHLRLRGVSKTVDRC